MRKVSILILFSVFISTASFAQSFSDGTNLLSIGFGIPPSQRITNDFNKTYKGFYDYRLKNYGTVLFKYEHGLIKYFGMGLNVEYSGAAVSFKYSNTTGGTQYQDNIKSTVLGFYARFNGHYPVSDKFDLYAGVGLGYDYTINKRSDTNPDTTLSHTDKIFDFNYQLTLGARYMIKEKFGMFFEVGRAATTAQVGFTFKF